MYKFGFQDKVKKGREENLLNSLRKNIFFDKVRDRSDKKNYLKVNIFSIIIIKKHKMFLHADTEARRKRELHQHRTSLILRH